MEHLNEAKYRHIDGQRLYFLSNKQWDEIVKNGMVNGVQISDILLNRLSIIDLPVSKKFPEIKLTCGYGGYKPFFYYYTLLKFNDFYQRVRINRVNCPNCSWEGYFADPYEPDVYLGVKTQVKRVELMRRVRPFVTENCPNCSQNIGRKRIWFG